jgi:sulfate adenylyltransferase subunit 1
MTLPSALPGGAEGTLLRLVTAGSVDDGKSTLIGRLLYDARQILSDQLDQMRETSVRRGADFLDLSLLTDGLRAEREQGITIDVAYRPFTTGRRRFLIADCPGHVQYTRNMVTGASTADCALLLVDARHGVVEQTRRHAFIAALLGIRHLVVCVNKMDLVDFAEERFAPISEELADLARWLDVPDLTVIPISALLGDNVVDPSERTPWYEGLPLLEHLEQMPVDPPGEAVGGRLAVQWVIRPAGDEEERRYAGQMAGGALRVGQDIVVLPSGLRTRLAGIDAPEGPVDEAFPPMSVSVRLADDVDVSRGDMLCDPDRPPSLVRELTATVCWMSEQPLLPGARYLLKHTSRTCLARIESIEHIIDVATFGADPDPGRLELNDIGAVRIRTQALLAMDPYRVSRTTGSFVLIDEATNDTVGAGMMAG